jgi:chromosome segregation ATPase
MGFFSKVEPVVQKIESTLEADVHAVFAKAKQAALDANSEVAKIKSDLQTALAKAADLHQEAIKLAGIAQAKAEQDIADLKSAIQAHTNDANTLKSQIIAKPAPAVETPVVETPST